MGLAKRLKNVESTNNLSEFPRISIGNNLLFAAIEPPLDTTNLNRPNFLPFRTLAPSLRRVIARKPPCQR